MDITFDGDSRIGPVRRSRRTHAKPYARTSAHSGLIGKLKRYATWFFGKNEEPQAQPQFGRDKLDAPDENLGAVVPRSLAREQIPGTMLALPAPQYSPGDGLNLDRAPVAALIGSPLGRPAPRDPLLDSITSRQFTREEAEYLTSLIRNQTEVHASRAQPHTPSDTLRFSRWSYDHADDSFADPRGKRLRSPQAIVPERIPTTPLFARQPGMKVSKEPAIKRQRAGHVSESAIAGPGTLGLIPERPLRLSAAPMTAPSPAAASSETARKLLQTLDRLATPLIDAKRLRAPSPAPSPITGGLADVRARSTRTPLARAQKPNGTTSTPWSLSAATRRTSESKTVGTAKSSLSGRSGVVTSVALSRDDDERLAPEQAPLALPSTFRFDLAASPGTRASDGERDDWAKLPSDLAPEPVQLPLDGLYPRHHLGKASRRTRRDDVSKREISPFARPQPKTSFSRSEMPGTFGLGDEGDKEPAASEDEAAEEPEAGDEGIEEEPVEEETKEEPAALGDQSRGAATLITESWATSTTPQSTTFAFGETAASPTSDGVFSWASSASISDDTTSFGDATAPKTEKPVVLAQQPSTSCASLPDGEDQNAEQSQDKDKNAPTTPSAREALSREPSMEPEAASAKPTPAVHGPKFNENDECLECGMPREDADHSSCVEDDTKTEEEGQERSQAASAFDFGASASTFSLGGSSGFSFGTGASTESGFKFDVPLSGAGSPPTFSATSPADQFSFSFGSTDGVSTSGTRIQPDQFKENPVFSFGASEPALAKQSQSTPFFASSAVASETATPFSFGASDNKDTQTIQEKAPVPAFSFGAVDNPTATQSFAFGEPFKEPSSAGFSMGVVSASSSSFSTDSKPASTDAPVFSFGGADASKAGQSQPFSFSAQTTDVALEGAAFGATAGASMSYSPPKSASTSEQIRFSFGDASTGGTSFGGFNVGAPSPAPPSSGFGFESASPFGGPSSSTGPFGNTSAAASFGPFGTDQGASPSPFGGTSGPFGAAAAPSSDPFSGNGGAPFSFGGQQGNVSTNDGGGGFSFAAGGGGFSAGVKSDSNKSGRVFVQAKRRVPRR